MRIRPLPPTLANQIAAGEVIERPASVLKELAENSIDAGARRIVIDVERGGMGLVRVRDDGEGIHKDDLELAVARHATSKLAEFDDLAAIQTMGFRGEALPSIASVSRFELTSRQRGAETAYVIKSDGCATSSEPAPARHAEGTSVSVRDLFFNTPARRRFLRSEKTELRHIEQLVKRLALARFDIAFNLNHGGRSSIDVRVASTDTERANRVGRLCGRSFADGAVEVDLQVGDMRLSGWVGGPSTARAYTDLQHFYVNGRIVRDSVARHALRQAYHDLVPTGRHPAYVLYLEVDPASVDVNVHPTKHEVRFRESRQVHDLLSRGVRRFLSDARGMPGFEDVPLGDGGVETGTSSPLDRGPMYSDSNSGSYDPGRPMLASRGAIAASHDFHRSAGEAEDASGAAIAELAQGAYGVGQVVSCTPSGYVLVSASSGIVIVDLRRALVALARIRWFELDRAAASARSNASGYDGFTPRPLLIPEVATFDSAVCDAVERNSGSLTRLGLDIRSTGPGRLSLRALPPVLASAEPAAVLQAAALACATTTTSEPTDPDSLLEQLLEAVDLAAGAARDRESLQATLRTLERFGCLRPIGEGAQALQGSGHLGPPGGPAVARVLDEDAMRAWLDLERPLA